MGFTDVLSTDSYTMVNLKYIELFGHVAAIYLSEIIRIIPKAVKKKAIIEGNYFKIKRDYIEERVKLDRAKQLECDSYLASFGIIAVKPDDEDCIAVNLEMLTGWVTDTDPSLIKEAQAVAKKQTKTKAKELKVKKTAATEEEKQTKTKAIIATMIRIALEVNPVKDETFEKAYIGWVEAVYANKRFLTREVITNFINTISKFSPDYNVQLEVISYATNSGYSEAAWAINVYNRAHQTNGRPAMINSTPQKVATINSVNTNNGI